MSYSPNIRSNENCIQWPLSDNAADAVVKCSDVGPTFPATQSVFVDGGTNLTETVASTISSDIPAMHFTASGQFVQVTLPRTWPSALKDKWVKAASNPNASIKGAYVQVKFGEVIPNPAGGFWFFASCVTANNHSIRRYSSTDMITWTDDGDALVRGGATDWDSTILVAAVVKKPDGTFVMIYTGENASETAYGAAGSRHMGIATWDGVTGIAFTRVSANPYLLNPLTYPSHPYDVTNLSYQDGTYYLLTNGTNQATVQGHGSQRLFTSTDLVTWAEQTLGLSTGMADGKHDHFCGSTFYHAGHYYLIVDGDFVASSTIGVYNRAIALYRSHSPLFPATDREFLGFPITNDGSWVGLVAEKTYDLFYLDSPSVACSGPERTAVFVNDRLYGIYAGQVENSSGQPADQLWRQNIVSISRLDLESLTPKLQWRFLFQPFTISFLIKFDTIADTPIFSVGDNVTDGTPTYLCAVKTSKLNLVLGGAYRATTPTLVENTLYHVVITDDGVTTKVYIDDVDAGLAGSTERPATTSMTYLAISSGYGASNVGKYIADFRIYPIVLTQTQRTRLHQYGAANVGADGKEMTSGSSGLRGRGRI
jgi:hypothetical protein